VFLRQFLFIAFFFFFTTVVWKRKEGGTVRFVSETLEFRFGFGWGKV